MNELLETERAYVEELLCVLQVSRVALSLCVHQRATLQSVQSFLSKIVLV